MTWFVRCAAIALRPLFTFSGPVAVVNRALADPKMRERPR